MIIISYDISNDKKRARLAKYLQKFGTRIQYSVFKIDHSERFLTTLLADLQEKYIDKLDSSDSVYVFKPCPSCEIITLAGGPIEESDFLLIE